MSVKTAIHIKDARLFLDECCRTRERLNIVALTQKGEKMELKGWIVASSSWRAGTHTFKNVDNGEFRRVRDVLIFYVNNHLIYM